MIRAMDKNDILRKLAGLKEERRGLYQTIADFTKKIADEKRGFSNEEDEQYQRMNADIDAKDSEIRSLEAQLEVIRSQESADEETAEELRSGQATVTNPFASDQYRSAFDAFVRTGNASDLRDLRRSMSGVTTSGGEEFVPTEFFSTVEARIKEETSLSSLINIQTIGSRHAKFAIHTGVSVAVPRAEGEAYGVNDPTTGQKEVDIFNFGHITKVSEELLEDSFTNVEQFIAMDQGEAYGNAIECFGINGEQGATLVGLTVPGVTGKVPTGLLYDTGIPEIETAAAGVVTLDDVIELTEDVPSAVSRNASILAHKSFVKQVRKLKDTTGQPLWQPNIQAGRPSTLNGHEVYRSDFMPAFAAGATPVLFGDFSRITMYARSMMTLMRLNEKYRDTGEIGFRGNLRMDLLARQPAALRRFKIKAA